MVDPSSATSCSRPRCGQNQTPAQHSFAFIQSNWIEWYVPNLLLGAAGWFAAPEVAALGIFGWVAEFILGALLHVVMVFRGHLYVALDGTSHRQRMFRYRTGM